METENYIYFSLARILEENKNYKNILNNLN